ncbi:keratin, type I cytoskeletal 10-like [Rana temporaria]|uniref:keratin, type I cytoskeletal 10-like n=1 Tax=Rana temporaria TaxID=8407 RepID=UPI001AAD9A5C|nr:keratin, type I cytoskeletal 10-like [Rana temporaria]
MSYRNSTHQESHGNSTSSRSFRHSEDCEDRGDQHTSSGVHNDEHITGPRGNTQRHPSARNTSGGHYGEEHAYGGSVQSHNELSNYRNDHRRSVVSGSDRGYGNDSFGNQKGGSSGVSGSGYSRVHSSGGSSISRAGQSGAQGGSSGGYTGGSGEGHSGDYDSASRRHDAVSRGGQSGSKGSSSGGYTGDSSGGHIGEYDSGSRRHDAVSRGGQIGSHDGSSGGYTGGSSGGNSGGHDSGSRGYAGASRGVQGGSHGGISGGYTSGSSSGGQSGGYGDSSRGHNSSSRGSTGVGGGNSGGQNGGHSGGFSSRSTGGFSNRNSANHQGFGGNSGQRVSFSNCSLGEVSHHQAGGKETMQNLNSRLATYMDRVRALEDSNAELEIKIRNWYDTHKLQKVDYTKYYKTIEELKNKMFSFNLDNNHLTVQNDNARLAADDFKVKYETERCLFQNVDADATGLRKALDDLTLDKASLESQFESLTEELAYRKRNHEEETKSMQGVSSDVTVQMDAAPGINILKILNDTRSQYEELAEANRKKAEEEYQQKISELKSEISDSNEQIESYKNQVMELRRTMQNLEIELQTQCATKTSLENAMAETEGRYYDELTEIQNKVMILEDELSQLRHELESQSQEYKILLDIRSKLENEIEMYRELLEEGSAEHGNSYGNANANGNRYNNNNHSSRQGGRSASSSVSDQRRSRVVTAITEERMDGRIVSTKVSEIHQQK